MFQKPFRVKSNSSVKGSDRKKIRTHLEKHYSNLTPEQLQELVPSKADIFQMKIFTHGGQSVIVYVIENNPVFFEFENKICPTVYTLWKYPSLLTNLLTWAPVFEKLLGGADLMQPGIVLKGDNSKLENLSVNDVVSVRIVGNLSPLAVGVSNINSEKLFSDDRKGKAVKILHTFGDHLWLAGNKSEPPCLQEDAEMSCGDDSDCEESCVTRVKDETSIERTTEKNSDEKDVHCKNEEDNALDEVARKMNDVGLSSKSEDMASLPPKSEQEMMDDLLLNCFLLAMKTKLKKVELPLLTSTLYSACILPCCPSTSALDIKKSSHKKLSVFLKSIQSEGLIEVKELSKGIESIVAINFEHPLVRTCRLKLEEKLEVCEEIGTQKSYSPPEIEDLFLVGAAVMPLFQPRNFGKGSHFTASEVRKLLTDYVRNENLQSPQNPRQVMLDPVLANTLLNKGEYLERLSWEDLMSRCLSKMQPAYRITFPNSQPLIKKGHIQPVDITVAQRTGNKKVTLVYNLETYGIDPEVFAHEVQVGVAASTSVGAAQARKGIQVMVQGNQIVFISKLLLERYCLPKKFISGLEKMPKKK